MHIFYGQNSTQNEENGITHRFDLKFNRGIFELKAEHFQKSEHFAGSSV